MRNEVWQIAASLSGTAGGIYRPQNGRVCKSEPLSVLNGTCQRSGYAHDVNILGESIHSMRKTLEALVMRLV